MADAFIGKTEIDPVAAEAIANNVQDYLHANVQLLRTCQDYSSMAVMGIDKIKIPKTGGFTVTDVGGAGYNETQALTMTTDDLALDKHKKVLVGVKNIANLQSQIG